MNKAIQQVAAISAIAVEGGVEPAYIDSFKPLSVLVLWTERHVRSVRGGAHATGPESNIVPAELALTSCRSYLWRVVVYTAGLMVIGFLTVPVSFSFDSDRDPVKKGTIEIGMTAGFWQATTAIGDAPSANRSAVFVLPRVGVVVTDPLGLNWWRGDLELIVEPVYARFTQPFAADLSGASLIAKYNFLSFGRWMPFWDIGAGMVWTNLAPRIPEESTQIEFLLQTGPGVQYVATETVTLTAGIRFSHISNANLGDRNTGINAVMPYVGLSFFLQR